MEVGDEGVVFRTRSVEEEVHRKAEIQLIREQLMTLDPLYRQTLLLVYEYGLTYQQLAAYQKTSISAVKSRIYRAKMKFRSLIRDAGMSC